MVNIGVCVIVCVEMFNGQVNYQGEVCIDGVFGSVVSVLIDFFDIVGFSCGVLLFSGNIVDVVEGVEIICIDNGMLVVLFKVSDFGLMGNELSMELEVNVDFKGCIKKIWLVVGVLMNLGDVVNKIVFKMSLVFVLLVGGVINICIFIFYCVYEVIGVLGLVSVVIVCMLFGLVVEQVSGMSVGDGVCWFDVEYLMGFFIVEMDVVDSVKYEFFIVNCVVLLCIVRLLMCGEVMVLDGVY